MSQCITYNMDYIIFILLSVKYYNIKLYYFQLTLLSFHYLGLLFSHIILFITSNFLGRVCFATLVKNKILSFRRK